ncbi:hypothetical protein Syun_026071 [Stephania yunnanensis]|uniref:Uncharacterized protein n=1 Tax=Stephania yunnanensis TaxID=152371 RepID=A0AAP0ETL6_9MAGN
MEKKMGFLSWWKGKGGAEPKPDEKRQVPVEGMNGAVEVPRPANLTIFEFGSAAASADKITLAGYCPVSDDLEPCRWEIFPATSPNDPQFREGLNFGTEFELESCDFSSRAVVFEFCHDE